MWILYEYIFDSHDFDIVQWSFVIDKYPLHRISQRKIGDDEMTASRHWHVLTCYPDSD